MATPHEEFRKAVCELATLHGWRCFWTWKSYHSPAGMFDLELLRGGQMIKAELKVGKDKLSPAQAEYYAEIKALEEHAESLIPNSQSGILGYSEKPLTGPPIVQVFVWRREVDTLDKIEEVLR